MNPRIISFPPIAARGKRNAARPLETSILLGARVLLKKHPYAAPSRSDEPRLSAGLPRTKLRIQTSLGFDIICSAVRYALQCVGSSTLISLFDYNHLIFAQPLL